MNAFSDAVKSLLVAEALGLDVLGTQHKKPPARATRRAEDFDATEPGDTLIDVTVTLPSGATDARVVFRRKDIRVESNALIIDQANGQRVCWAPGEWVTYSSCQRSY